MDSAILGEQDRELGTTLNLDNPYRKHGHLGGLKVAGGVSLAQLAMLTTPPGPERAIVGCRKHVSIASTTSHTDHPHLLQGSNLQQTEKQVQSKEWGGN